MALQRLEMPVRYRCLLQGPNGVYEEILRVETVEGDTEACYELWKYGGTGGREPPTYQWQVEAPFEGAPQRAVVLINTMPAWWQPPTNSAELSALWERTPLSVLPVEARQANQTPV